jgi:muramoyltetrapeptide carboxypeptidase
MNPPLLPPPLRRGDAVAIVSPSWGGAGILGGRTERAIAALQAAGYSVRLGAHALGTGDGLRAWLSGSRAERLADLHAAFADPAVRGVIAAIGGDHSAQLLAELDLELVRRNPKVLCGYSDTTCLLHAVHAATGLVTFYGPAALPEFGEIGGPDREVVEQFARVTGDPQPAGPLPRVAWQASESRIESDAAGRSRAREAGEQRRALRPGAGSGPLLVGCLPSVRQLVGTRWQPEWRGSVLVLELPGEPYDPARADADLTHLRNAGLLAGLAALGVGRTDGWSRPQMRQLEDVLREAVRDYRYPVLTGLECSHAAPLLTLPIGVAARIDHEELVIEGAAVAG